MRPIEAERERHRSQRDEETVVQEKEGETQTQIHRRQRFVCCFHLDFYLFQGADRSILKLQLLLSRDWGKSSLRVKPQIDVMQGLACGLQEGMLVQYQQLHGQL